MIEQLLQVPEEDNSARNLEAAAIELGKITVLEALAEETTYISADNMDKTTMIRSLDYMD